MSYDGTLGALLVGCYVAVSLYGLTSHQMYRYFRMYPNDQMILKALVAGTWGLDTLHTVFVTHACYYYLVTSYLDLQAAEKSVWSLRVSFSLTGAITTMVHAFFSRRIYVFSRSFFIAGAIMAISIIRLCCAIATTTVSFLFVPFSRFDDEIWLVCLTLGLSIASDVIITCSLCWFLQKSKTGFERTDGIIDKLLLYAINTGLLCIIFDFAVLACAGSMRKNLVYLGLYFIISKLYSNSLLAVLNSRSGLVRDNQHGSFELKDMALDHENLDHQDVHPVLHLRRRQTQRSKLGISFPQGRRISIGQALDELKSQRDDCSESSVHQQNVKVEDLGILTSGTGVVSEVSRAP